MVNGLDILGHKKATDVFERWEFTVDGLVAVSEGSRLGSMEEKVLSGDHGRLSKRLALLREAPRVPRDQAGPSNVAELQHQHDNTLEANTSPTVRRGAPLETVQIVCHRVGVDLGLPHLLLEEDSIVNALTTGKDLLTANENVVRVG